MADERLRGHVEHDLRAARGHEVPHHFEVADVADGRAHAALDTRQLEQRRLGGHAEGEAAHVGAELAEPEAQPAPLEARVAGDRHAAALPRSAV
jgi:hypothetical protein